MAERCDKLAGIDVAAYLDNPGDARWGSVPAHVEKCHDCREEVAAWQALRASLAADGDGHPPEDQLLAYADHRSSLATSVVEGIEAHLTQCVSCRDEVGVLGAVTIRPIDAVAATPAPTLSQMSAWQRVLAALSGPAWRPALAVAVLVVLTVPALRWIDREGALMELGAERNREAMTVSTEDGIAERAVTNSVGARTPVADTTDALRGSGAMDAGTRVNVPAPAPAPPPATAPPLHKTEEARAVDELGRVAPSQESRDTDPRPSETDLHAGRRGNPFGADALSALAMKREGERGVSQTALTPTLEFVPGGRVTLAAGDSDRVVVRVTFVRGVNLHTKERERETLADETARYVVVPPNLSHLEVRVTTADGRENRRRLDAVFGESAPGTSIVEISIPIDWFAIGENKVDIVDDEGHEVARLDCVFNG